MLAEELLVDRHVALELGSKLRKNAIHRFTLSGPSGRRGMWRDTVISETSNALLEIDSKLDGIEQRLSNLE